MTILVAQTSVLRLLTALQLAAASYGTAPRGTRIRFVSTPRILWYPPQLTYPVRPIIILKPSNAATTRQSIHRLTCDSGIDGNISTCPYYGNSQVRAHQLATSEWAS
jgi:hypothetical protein